MELMATGPVVVLVDAQGETAVGDRSKRELADAIWDRVLELRKTR